MKRFFMVVFLMLCMMASSAFAEERVMNIDVSKDFVTVSGNLSDKRAGYLVGIRIKKEGAEEYSYIEQKKTEKGGAYEFIFVPKNDNGNFQMYVYFPDEDVTVEKRFAYYSPKVIEEMIEQLNSSETIEEIESLAVDNGIAFGISDELLDEYNDKELLPEVILNYLTDGGQFSTKEEIVTFAEKTLHIDKVNGAMGEDILPYLEEIVDAYTFSLISDFEDIAKGDILKRLEAGKKYNNLNSFEDKIREAVVLGVIESINGYGDAEKIIKNTTEYTGISLEKFSKISNKSAVLKSVTGKNYNSFEELKGEFDRSVEKFSGSNGSGSGGKSGGGSGSGGGYLVPVKVEGEKNKTEETDKNEKTIGFSDIDSTHWAWGYINNMYLKGIINGKSDSIFEPEGLITREEFVKMLVLSAGYSTDDAESEFLDVSKSEWYYPYVSAAKKNGIINGISEDTFGVGAPIKRQDMFVIIYRTMLKKEGKLEGLNGQLPFDDAEDVSEYAEKALETVYRLNLLNGNNNLCNPHKNATRAEAAKVLSEALTE